MSEALTVTQALALARAAGVARLDAQILLAHQWHCARSWLLAHDDALLDAPATAVFRARLVQRAAGVPLAYLVGSREFHGLDLQVSPAVLVPRPETEGLVDWAIEVLVGRKAPQVADLGTGSGAIALAIKKRLPQVRMLAADASADALAIARTNAARHGLALEWAHGDWWAPLAGRRFDLVLSNPPYIAADDPHLAALAHEPRSALTPGGDGLGALRRIVADAPAHLLPGGWLLLEHGHDQGGAVQQLLESRGFGTLQMRHDLAGLPRISGARWAG